MSKSNRSKIPLNFKTEDFSQKNFLDFIVEPNGKKIKYFSVLMSKEDKIVEPNVFWLNTGEEKWYRFFLDAWLFHWDEYHLKEKEDLIKEDFEECDDFFVRDLFTEFNLKDKVINEIEVSRFFKEQIYTTQVKISIDDSLQIKIRDFGDERSSELIIISRE